MRILSAFAMCAFPEVGVFHNGHRKVELLFGAVQKHHQSNLPLGRYM